MFSNAINQWKKELDVLQKRKEEKAEEVASLMISTIENLLWAYYFKEGRSLTIEYSMGFVFLKLLEEGKEKYAWDGEGDTVKDSAFPLCRHKENPLCSDLLKVCVLLGELNNTDDWEILLAMVGKPIELRHRKVHHLKRGMRG